MSELEDRVDELERKIEEKDAKISELECKFEAFAKPCAIGHEQLWELVRGLQGLPVPNGVNDVDLRDLV
jgi:predicted RNase H-like nuclease (RuvC/YqgF family)